MKINDRAMYEGEFKGDYYETDKLFIYLYYYMYFIFLLHIRIYRSIKKSNYRYIEQYRS